MALIRQSEAERVARNAVTLHLGDLRREGDALVADAKIKAEAIMSGAKAERERLVADASAKGYDTGYAEGLAAGLAKGRDEGTAEALQTASGAFASLAETWGLALARFEDDREQMIAEARTDVVRLAAVFAERVTKRVVELDPGVAERQIEAVLRAAIRPTRVIISVHPDDEAEANRALPGLMKRFAESGHGEVAADATLERGSCVARMASGAVIDASISTQIDRLVAELLPAGDDQAGEGVSGGPS